MTLKVEEILEKRGVEYRVIKLRAPAFTVADVHAYSDGKTNAEETCKTIILRGKKTNKKFAVFLRGGDKVHFSVAKRLFGEEMAIATAEEVKEVSGVDPGAVCPFMLTAPLFVDKKVLELETINCGSGDHLHGLEFKTKDLGKGVRYEVVELAKEVDNGE